MNRNIALLWQGQVVSQLGSQAYGVVMMFWLMEATGSATLMSLVMTLSMLPYIILGPVAGVFVDNLNRRNILIWCDLLRGLAVMMVAALMFFMPDATSMIIVGFIVASFFNGAARAFFNPAVSALIVDLAEPKKLIKVNAMFQSTEQASLLIGQAVGGVLYRVIGAPVLLFFDAISYLLSALSEMFIKVKPEQQHKQGSVSAAMGRFKTDLVEGLNFARHTPGVIGALLFVTAVNFFCAPLVLFMPFYAEQQLQAGVEWYGFLMAAMGGGTLLGNIVIAALKLSVRVRPAFMLISITFFGAGIAAIGQTDNAWLALGLMTLVGFSVGGFSLHAITLFQGAAPVELRGRLMSLVLSASAAALPMGLVLSGLAGEWTDNNIPMLFAVAGAGIALVVVIVATRKAVLGFMSSEPYVDKAA